jgi:hypothetical protein
MSRLLTVLLSALVVVGSVALGIVLAFFILLVYLTLIGVPFA